MILKTDSFTAADFKIKLKRTLIRKCQNIKIRTDLQTMGIYFVKHWLLKFMLDFEEEQNKLEICVRSLSSNVDENMLLEIFSKYGTTSKCKLVMKDGQSQGFIEYEKHSEAAKALAAENGANHFGRDISVEYSDTEYEGDCIFSSFGTEFVSFVAKNQFKKRIVKKPEENKDDSNKKINEIMNPRLLIASHEPVRCQVHILPKTADYIYLP